MPGRLDIGKIVFGAFVIPWRDRHAFARVLWPLFLALICISLLWIHLPDTLRGRVVWVLYAIYWLLLVLFAVDCHRLVLLDPAARRLRALPSWSRRETRFALMSIALLVLAGLAIYAASTVLLNLPWVRSAGEGAAARIVYLALVPAYYVFARLSVVLPATAVDRRIGLKWAWRSTKRNGWRLVVVVGVLPWLISEFVNLTYRSNPTIIETIVFSAFAYALTVVEIAALSLSYRELTTNEMS